MKFRVKRASDSNFNNSQTPSADHVTDDIQNDEGDETREDDVEIVTEDDDGQEAAKRDADRPELPPPLPSSAAAPDDVIPAIAVSQSSPSFTSNKWSWSSSLRRAGTPAGNDSNAQLQSTGTFLQHVTRLVAERGRAFARRHTRRLVFKDGSCNVVSKNVTQRRRRYLVDLFTTMIDMKWRYHAAMFAMAFVASWMIFALIWWIQAFINGDLEAGKENPDGHMFCVDNVYDYRSALLFSIETQQTIGYGYRGVSTHCAPSVVILMAQSCIGVFIQCLTAGIVFSKLSRPKSRAQTIMFSRQAVVCLRDRQYCLLFRVGDMRRSHIIGTSVRVVMIKNRLTREGESIPLCQYPMSVETDGSSTDSFLFLVWPVTVVHRIDENSPLWDMSAEQMLKERFEIIVILEGTVECNGKLTQVRTSYLPGEILWGHRLTPLMTFEKSNGQYDIDYRQFHAATAMSMPDMSAKTFASRRDAGYLSIEPPQEDYPINFTAPAVKSRADTLGSTPRQLYRRLRHGLHRGPAGGKQLGQQRNGGLGGSLYAAAGNASSPTIIMAAAEDNHLSPPAPLNLNRSFDSLFEVDEEQGSKKNRDDTEQDAAAAATTGRWQL